MTIKDITPKDSYLIYLNFIPNVLFRPFTIGLLLYIARLCKRTKEISLIEILFTFSLIYQLSLLIEFIEYEILANNMIDFLMFDNNSNNSNSSNTQANNSNIPLDS